MAFTPPFFSGPLAKGQVVISGKMTDLKNKPLRGASVSIKDSYDGSTTDSLGMFRFTTTEKGIWYWKRVFLPMIHITK